MRTRDTVYIALFAGITAALALFPPLPLSVTGVPITAQSMGPMIAGAVLGWKRGALSQVLLLLLVAVGLPLLAGGTGGLGVFAGVTGGYLVAWPLAALVIGWLYERMWRYLNFPLAVAIVAFGGIVVVYAVGSAWVAASTRLDYLHAVAANSPFLIGDGCKVVLTSAISLAVRRAYPVIKPRQRRRLPAAVGSASPAGEVSSS